MALTKIGTDGFKDDAVTADKLANAINTERTANTAKVSTTINNNADNRVITGSGTANTLNGESTVVVDANGNLGIGTTSPRSLLDLGAGSGDGALSSTLSQYQIMLEAPQGEGDYGRNIGWSVGTNGLTAAINAVDVGASDATGLTFITGTNSSVAERMRIDSSGNVGIGEATPLAQLHIKPATNKSQLLLEQNNAVDGYALFQDGPNGGHLKFMRHVNGTETQKLLLRNDGGLCFGTDSAAANALDDYEEGTHTPSMFTDSGSITLKSSADTLAYTKIGRVVHVTGRLDMNSVSSPSGDLGISLPFTVANNITDIGASVAPSVFIYNATGGATGEFVAWADGNVTAMYIRLGSNTYGTGAASLMQANTEIRVSATYFTHS